MQNQYLQQQLLYNIVKAREGKKSESAFFKSILYGSMVGIYNIFVYAIKIFD